jgi:hypothetical protein
MERKEGKEPKGKEGASYIVGIDEGHRRGLQASAEKFRSLAAFWFREKGEETEEGMGLYRRGFSCGRG